MKKTGRQDHWLDRIGAADDDTDYDGPRFVPNKVVKRQKLSTRSEPSEFRSNLITIPAFAIGPPSREVDRKHRLWRQAFLNLIKRNGIGAGIGPPLTTFEMRAIDAEWIANPNLYQAALEIAEWSKPRYLIGVIKRGEFVPFSEEDRRRLDQLD